MKYPKQVLTEIRHLPEQSTPGIITTKMSIEKLRELPDVDPKLLVKYKDMVTGLAMVTTKGVPVNHERRMKEAYKSGGRIAYLLYFQAYVKPGDLKLKTWEEIAKESGVPLTEEIRRDLLGLNESPAVLNS
jgi:hypothetical protein